MSKTNLFTAIPLYHVMAFNAVSAPAYVGHAIAVKFDGSLDDEPDLDVIVVARDHKALQRFHERIGQPFDKPKTKEVAVAWTSYLRIHTQVAIKDGEHGKLNPNHRDQDEL